MKISANEMRAELRIREEQRRVRTTNGTIRRKHRNWHGLTEHEMRNLLGCVIKAGGDSVSMELATPDAKRR